MSRGQDRAGAAHNDAAEKSALLTNGDHRRLDALDGRMNSLLQRIDIEFRFCRFRLAPANQNGCSQD